MRSRKWYILILGFILIGLVTYYAFNFQNLTKPLFTTKTSPVPKPKFETPWQREDEWIIFSVLSDIYGMLAFYAQEGRVSYDDLAIKVTALSEGDSKHFADAPMRYEVVASIPQCDEDIRLELNFADNGSHIFAPQAYWDWARTLIDLWIPDVSSVIPASGDESVALMMLQSPTSVVIQKENQRISRWLQAAPLDPIAHEEAALLLGVLSLREASGVFSDLRPNLIRSTAHLAVSMALATNPGQDPLRTTAMAIHHLLVNDQLQALDCIETIGKFPEENIDSALSGPWKAALHTRVTGDWRGLSNKSERSFLEKLELFRAICKSVSPDSALEWVRESEQNLIPLNAAARWVAEEEFGVAEGHALLKKSLTAELQELAAVFEGAPFLNDFNQVISFLNQTDRFAVDRLGDGKARYEVIPKGLWAGFFQRHLMHRMVSEYRFYKRVWGVDEYADLFYRQAREHFAALQLFPAFMRICAISQAQFRSAVDMVSSTIKKKPEVFPPSTLSIFERTRGEVWTRGNALLDLEYMWFYRGLLPGTNCDVTIRTQQLVPKSKQMDIYRSVLQRAPFDFENCRCYCESLQSNDSLDDNRIVEAYGALTDFNLKALKEVAEWYAYHSETEKYIASYRRICSLDPDRCFELGDILARSGHEDEAVAAYQEGVDKARDVVAVANQSEWLVSYYYDHGQKNKALEVAEKGARVGSYLGFRTLARLLEKMEDLKGAEVYYRKIYERYKDPEILLEFLLKYEEEQIFQTKIMPLLDDVFPQGLHEMSLPSAAGAPQSGLIFTKSKQWMKRYGLTVGDIIIAVNGYAVANMPQLLAAAAYDRNGLDGQALVWRKNRYVEIKLPPPPHATLQYILEAYARPNYPTASEN